LLHFFREPEKPWQQLIKKIFAKLSRLREIGLLLGLGQEGHLEKMGVNKLINKKSIDK